MIIVPAALKELNHWVLWRHESLEGRLTKVPYCANGGLHKASSTDPKTWAAFDDAVQSAKVHKMDGVGFVSRVAVLPESISMAAVIQRRVRLTTGY